MNRAKQISFFHSPQKCNSGKKIWENFQPAFYQNDAIELQLNAHYVSQNSLQWKPIYIELGKKTLYCTKKEKHSGCLALNFTIMSLRNFQGQKLLCLSKNSKSIEIKFEDSEKIIAQLLQRCIQTSFHEDFQIEKLIANGNKKAMVYQGIRKSNNERVAVKAYSKEFIRKFPQGIECLKNEIKALRMLDSEHIIQLREVHETENSIYLIMDLIEGGQLTQRMSLSHSDIRQLMFNLITTLSLIHQQKLILRNISPENILFKNQDSIDDLVIIDFGEVLFDQTQCKPFRASGYMAPELFESQTVNAKCDIYSIGVIFYSLVVQNIFEEEAKPIYCDLEGEKFKQAPKALQSIIKKMLRKDPKRRYSAEKCLQHRYFKKIIDKEGNQSQKQSIDPIRKQNLEKSINSMQLIGIDGENDNFQNGFRRSQSGSSIQSLPSKFSKERSLQKFDKNTNFTKFRNFLSFTIALNSPQNKKKGQEESLLKRAIRNSCLNQEFSKDDYSEVSQFKQIIKKRNSLDI